MYNIFQFKLLACFKTTEIDSKNYFLHENMHIIQLLYIMNIFTYYYVKFIGKFLIVKRNEF